MINLGKHTHQELKIEKGQLKKYLKNNVANECQYQIRVPILIFENN